MLSKQFHGRVLAAEQLFDKRTASRRIALSLTTSQTPQQDLQGFEDDLIPYLNSNCSRRDVVEIRCSNSVERMRKYSTRSLQGACHAVGFL